MHPFSIFVRGLDVLELVWLADIVWMVFLTSSFWYCQAPGNGTRNWNKNGNMNGNGNTFPGDTIIILVQKRL